MNANKGCLNVIYIAHFLWPQIATGKLQESGKNIPIQFWIVHALHNVYNHTICTIKSTMFTKYDLIILFWHWHFCHVSLVIVRNWFWTQYTSFLDVSFYKKFHAFSYSISIAKKIFNSYGVVWLLHLDLRWKIFGRGIRATGASSSSTTYSAKDREHK